jgi:hypothetical protein
MDAYKDIAWWSNKSSSIHTKAWLNSGWEVQEVNLKEGYVTFKEVPSVAFKKSKQKKLEITKPFTPCPYIDPDQRFHRKPRFQSFMQESRTLSGKDQCHASQLQD